MPKRDVVRPDGFPVPHASFTPAIRYGRWAFISGVMATDFASGLAPEARVNPAVPFASEHPMLLECRHILRLLERAAKACGTGLANAVRIDQFPTTREVADAYHVELKSVTDPPRPASTSVEIEGLMVPKANTEVELICILPEDGTEKEAITTDRIPQPMGGYAPAIRTGDFVFLAGQVPSDFKTGLAPEAKVDSRFWEGNAIDKQARHTLENLKITLEASGSSLDNVVKASVYLTDLNDLPRLERVWREYFPTNPPARTILPINSTVVPDGRIEITLVALRNDGKTRKEVVATDAAPKPLFHEPQAIRAGEFLFLSGQLGVDEQGLVPAAKINPSYPYAISSPAEQMRRILENAQAICDAAGSDLRHALRLLTIHTDLREYAQCIELRRGAFPDGQPATTTIGVRGPLQVPGCTIAADLWVGMP